MCLNCTDNKRVTKQKFRRKLKVGYGAKNPNRDHPTSPISTTARIETFIFCFFARAAKKKERKKTLNVSIRAVVRSGVCGNPFFKRKSKKARKFTETERKNFQN